MALDNQSYEDSSDSDNDDWNKDGPITATKNNLFFQMLIKLKMKTMTSMKKVTSLKT